MELPVRNETNLYVQVYSLQTFDSKMGQTAMLQEEKWLQFSFGLHG